MEQRSLRILAPFAVSTSAKSAHISATFHGPEGAFFHPTLRFRIEWTVATLGYAPGEQPNGTLVIEKPSELERQLAESVRQVQARKAAQMAETAAPAWTEALVSQTNALVDAYAQVLKHSSRHEGLVKGEDIRSIFLSAFINVTKGARNAA